MKFILAEKLNMTQLYSSDGKRFPVTVLRAGANKISRLKNEDKDGYQAAVVQSGKKQREFKVLDAELKTGQELKVTDFEPGDKVKVSSLSRGRGFTGFMKRHGFHGAPASHGHPHQRVAGSIGQAFPQHTRKGIRMAGRMGGQMVTETGLTVVAVEPEKSLIFVKGSVPGSTGSFLKIVTTGKKKELAEIHSFVEEKAPEEQKDASKNEGSTEKVAAASEPRPEGREEKKDEPKAAEKAEAKEPEAKTEATSKDKAVEIEEKQAEESKKEEKK